MDFVDVEHGTRKKISAGEKQSFVQINFLSFFLNKISDSFDDRRFFLLEFIIQFDKLLLCSR